MKDSECKVYFYYLISDEIQLYGWSTKEKTAKLFEKTRDMSQFEKSDRLVNVSELEEFFMEYGDNFIDDRFLSYGDYKVKVPTTKLEWINIQNAINMNVYQMQKSVMNINIEIFSNRFRKDLNIVGLDKCVYSLSLNAPPIQILYTTHELGFFMLMYGNYMKPTFVDEIKYVGKDKEK